VDKSEKLKKARAQEQRTANRVHDELTDHGGLSFDTLESWVDAKIALAAAVEAEGGS
jgi:hypothetical protein